MNRITVRPMKYREIVKILRVNGWYEKLPRKGTSHRYYVHNIFKGKIPIPKHAKEIPAGTIKSILKQAKLI